MNDTERKRIKPQLLKCAKENENNGTFTGYVIVSSVCRAAVERIEELEKENAELRNNGFTVSAMTEQQLKVAIEKGEQLEKENADQKDQLAKAKDLIEDMYDKIPSSHSDYYKDVMERARQFIKEIEK